VGQGHSLASLSLASHKRGVGSSDGVWGADWAAVVSPSPRDEASAKQVLPWRDRHGPLNGDGNSKTAVGSPVCDWAVPWLCCAAPPAARDRCQCTTDQPYPICHCY
jgi:hypothetical protein